MAGSSPASGSIEDGMPPPQPPYHQPHPLVSLVSANFPPIAYGFAYGSGVFLQPDLYTPEEQAAAKVRHNSHSSQPTDSTGPNPGAGGSSSSGSNGPMIDFIFVVDDPEDWHEQNMERNPRHYSAVRWLGPAAVAGAAEGIGAGLWFNTLVPVDGRLVKYGVISRNAFLEDMTTWQHLYVPGRMHKPVLPLISLFGGEGSGAEMQQQQQHDDQQQQHDDQQQQYRQHEREQEEGWWRQQQKPHQHEQQQARRASEQQHPAPHQQRSHELQLHNQQWELEQLERHLHRALQRRIEREHIAAAIDANLVSALRVALLLSPQTTSFRDLVRRIAGLSYHGDVRMGLAEDSSKVERIVAGSFSGFCDLYLPLLEGLQADTAAADHGAPDGGGLPSLQVLIESGGGGGGAGGSGGGSGSAVAVARGAGAGQLVAGGRGGGGVVDPFFRITIHQDVSDEARAHSISQLPASLLLRIASRTGVERPWAAAAAMQVSPEGAAGWGSAGGGSGGGEGASWARSELAAAAAAWRKDVAWAAVHSGRHEQLIHSGLRAIIRSSSARQAAVGVLSAGAVKSARYMAAKLAKAWRWRRAA